MIRVEECPNIHLRVVDYLGTETLTYQPLLTTLLLASIDDPQNPPSSFTVKGHQDHGIRLLDFECTTTRLMV